MIPVLIFSGWIYYLLYSLNPLLAWVWNVVTLYLTMGFRQFSYSLTEIEEALKNEDLFLARNLLRELHGVEADDLSSQEIARITIEMGLIYSHRYVFGIIICFALLPGPLGAVLYRLRGVIE